MPDQTRGERARAASARPRRWGDAALAASLVVVYLLLMAAGYGVLRSTAAIARGNELSADRALFTTINAASLTGFTTTVGLRQLLMAGQVAVIGLVIVGSILSLVVGGLAVVRIAGLPYRRGQVVATALLMVLAAPLLGGLLPGTGPNGAMLALSALSNSGLSLGPLPAGSDLSVHAVLMPLAFLGGLGVPVALELLDLLLIGRRLSAYSRTVLAMAAVVYLVGLGALSLLHTSGSWSEALAAGSVAAINSRSAGFAFGWTEFRAPAEWILLLLMLLGAGSGGTAGGLKVTTVAVIARGMRDILAGRAPGRIVGIALVWLASYLLLVLMSLILLIAFTPSMPAERLLLLAISAAGNVGLAHDPVSLTGASSLVLSATMLLGRLMPLAVLWWTALTTHDAEIAVA
jgi:trk system potassium uptake protein TrkH